uniref:Nuclear receptor n=1 Tax=Brachionus rotundiformis TaxID=96890 RepID=A0A221CAY1_9BILA|nr:nuclear receptor [Brachionus rotundiformis]
MSEKTFSDQEILDALLTEYNLNKKRVQTGKFEAKYNFGKCRICNGEATGIHYGVCTCEGCKGFFKRSLTRHKSYVCIDSKNCTICPMERRKCKFCRWMACLNAGMSLSGVRVGRIPNNMKEITLKNQREITSTRIYRNSFCLGVKECATFHKIDPKILPKISIQEKYLNCSDDNKLLVLSLLRDRSYQIFIEQTLVYNEHKKRALELIGSNYKPKLNLLTDTIHDLRQKDMLAMKKHAQSMFKIIEELPGFDRLTRKDLQFVLNDGFFTVSIVLTMSLFIDGDYFLMLDDQTPMTSEVFALLTTEDVRNSIFDFFKKLKKLNLTDQESALLIPIFLSIFSFDKPLEKPEILRELSEYYSRAMYYEFTLKNRSHEFITNFSEVIYLFSN